MWIKRVVQRSRRKSPTLFYVVPSLSFWVPYTGNHKIVLKPRAPFKRSKQYTYTISQQQLFPWKTEGYFQQNLLESVNTLQASSSIWEQKSNNWVGLYVEYDRRAGAIKHIAMVQPLCVPSLIKHRREKMLKKRVSKLSKPYHHILALLICKKGGGKLKQ